MKADARLVAEYRDGRTILRELRSMAPLTLFPKRTGGDAVVHLVNSATSPLGGDDLRLTVIVGAGARLRLSGVAATLALPGQHADGSHSTLDVHVERGGRFEYLPEPTVVTSRARHTAELFASLDDDARLRVREVLVLGRVGERPGSLRTTQRIVRGQVPLLHQTLDVGSLRFAARRVLATEILVGEDPVEPAGGDWWSVTPLAAGGALFTALAPDAVTAAKDLDRARACFPKMSW
ncbi:urease accessory protein UreD [Amycolatopsis sp. GM8]|uniref:urease accessory protein UreD n=1 Tax=Amycolatopsis sp. GM8 TaxID=2896530 RepID=UPI001F3DE024|nr:urease accessory protein UreD [Amycolatopsis sp. GM8]